MGTATNLYAGTTQTPLTPEEQQKKAEADAIAAGDAGKPYAPLPGTYTDAGAGRDFSKIATPGPISITGPQQKDTTYDTDPHAAVVNDVATSRLERDRLLGGYQNYQDRAAPTVGGVEQAPAAQAAPTTVGSAAAIPNTTVGPAAQAGASPAVAAGGIAPTTIGGAATIGASTVAPTGNARAGFAQAGPIDTGQQAQFRTAQQGLVTALQAAAAGNGPSAAQAQLQKGNDEAIKQQASMAAGAHGTSRLTQRLLAGYNTADLMQKNANDSAILKAQEQQTARAQLGTAVEGARGQDIGLATTGAQLATDVSKTNAGLQTTTSISNADRAAAASMKNAELQQAAASGNAAAINELKSREAALTSNEKVAAAANALDASKATAANATAIEVANMQAKNQMAQLQAQITAQQGIATAEQQNEMAKLQAQLTSGENQFNAGQTNDLAKQQAVLQLQAKVADMDASLKARGLDDAQRQSLINAYIQEQQQALGWDISQQGIQASKDAATKQIVGAAIGGGATVGAVLASDERAKTNIRPTSAKDMKLFIKALGAHDYEYKDKADGEGDFTGPMAQELEKSKVGKSTVIEGPGGKKMVDTRRLTMALASAVARMAKEAA